MADTPPFLRDTSLAIPSPERIAALWAFTRAQRDANPAGYESNVRWWGGALGALLAAGGASGAGEKDTLVLKADDALLGQLARGNGVRPRGIGGTIDALATPTGPFIPLARFMDSPTPIEAAPGIASRLIGAGWGIIARLSPFGGEATEDALWKRAKGKEFVYLPNVKTAATAFEERTTESPPITYTDALYTRASFLKDFTSLTDAPLTKHDVDVLLTWLARDVGSVVVDGDVIKLLTAGQVPAEHPISEADRGALSVLRTLAGVDAQIAAVEKEAAECQVKAKAKLAAGQRASAASYLRSKKQLDEVLAKRLAAGEQLRAVVRALDQAKGDAEVMSAYEASTAALASALADPRLSADRIASTTDALAEALADQKEVDDAIQMGGALSAPDIDEDELAKELEALALEEKEEKEKREKEERAEAAKRAEEARAAEEKRAAEDKLAEEKRLAEGKLAEAMLNKPQESDDAMQASAEARLARLAAPGAPGAPVEASPSSIQPAAWEEVHAAAQERAREEKARADAEQLRKDEARILAE